MSAGVSLLCHDKDTVALPWCLHSGVHGPPLLGCADGDDLVAALPAGSLPRQVLAALAVAKTPQQVAESLVLIRTASSLKAAVPEQSELLVAVTKCRERLGDAWPTQLAALLSTVVKAVYGRSSGSV